MGWTWRESAGETAVEGAAARWREMRPRPPAPTPAPAPAPAPPSARAWVAPAAPGALLAGRGPQVSAWRALGRVAGGVLLVGTLAATAAGLPASGTSASGLATTLILFALLALGAERLLELLWTVIGLIAGAGWPLGAVTRQLRAMRDGLSRAMEPLYDLQSAVLARLEETGRLGGAALLDARGDLATLRRIGDELGALPADKHHLLLWAGAAAQHLSYVQARYTAQLAGQGLTPAEETEVRRARELAEARAQGLGQAPAEIRAAGAAAAGALRHQLRQADPTAHLDAAVRHAGDAIGAVTDFLAALRDTPARRLISLCAGAVLGVALAGAVGLNLFGMLGTAPGLGGTVGPAEPGGSGLALPAWGTLLTGLLLGLAAGPVHDLIAAVQAYRWSHQATSGPHPLIQEWRGLPLTAPTAPTTSIASPEESDASGADGAAGTPPPGGPARSAAAG